MMNGDKDCKTAEEIKEINHINNMIKLFETKNWEAMLAIYNALFYARIKDYPNEKREAIAKVAVEQRCYL